MYFLNVILVFKIKLLSKIVILNIEIWFYIFQIYLGVIDKICQLLFKGYNMMI